MGVGYVVVMVKVGFREQIRSSRVLTCVQLQMCVCVWCHYDIMITSDAASFTHVDVQW